VTVADPDRPEQVPGPGKSRRIYTRGGRLSDLERLLAKNETERESRLVWRLVIAGIVIAVVIAVVVVATLRFLGR
jgi:hypothetical protein